jgi:hypothetical protein
LFIEKQKVTGQNVDIYTFQMILRFVVKTFEEENSLLLPEVYDRYKPASMKRFEPISPLLHQI